MPDSLYTEQRTAQRRGPTNSDDYNSRIEENYKDLIYLYNKIGLADEDLARAYQRLLKDMVGMQEMVDHLEDRISVLEAGENKLTFHSSSQIDNARFEGTQFAIPSVNRCYHESQAGLLVLPKVASGSVSKLKFVNNDGSFTVPSTFETVVRGRSGTADDSVAVIDTSEPYFAVVNHVGKVWERNVIVNSAHGADSIVDLYVRFPTDMAVTEDTNAVYINPFPMMGAELVGVYYTTDTDLLLNDTDNWLPLNNNELYDGEADAVGWVAPGAWSGDTIEDCGPKMFYFDPKPITGLKITLKQESYFREASKVIYSYGLSKLDARYEKFLAEGKTIIRFDAPQGETITSVDSITPEIWNVSAAELDDVFSYRLIYETSYNSGIYVTTPPGAPANRVWVEVTLNKTVGKGTPALSGLVLEYT